jgi:aminoglycoside phosphotransferase family enzyme
MKNIRKGSTVARKSYNSDILFIVEDIVCVNNIKYANLKGITLRIKANAPIDDLKIIDKNITQNEINKIDKKINENIEEKRDFFNQYINMFSGKILHLDGDTHLSNLKKCSNINTYKQVIFNHNLNNVLIC